MCLYVVKLGSQMGSYMYNFYWLSDIIKCSKFSVTPFESLESLRVPQIGGAQRVGLALREAAVRMALLSTPLLPAPPAPQPPGCWSNKLSSVQPPAFERHRALTRRVLPSASHKAQPSSLQAWA